MCLSVCMHISLREESDYHSGFGIAVDRIGDCIGCLLATASVSTTKCVTLVTLAVAARICPTPVAKLILS